MLGLVALTDKPPRERRGQLRIDEKTH